VAYIIAQDTGAGARAAIRPSRALGKGESVTLTASALQVWPRRSARHFHFSAGWNLMLDPGAPKGCGGEGGQVTGMSTPQDPQLPPSDPDPERNPPGPPPVPIRDPEEPGHLKFIGWGHSETVQLLCGHGRHRPDPGPFP
jgi:hypothetical protein